MLYLGQNLNYEHFKDYIMNTNNKINDANFLSPLLWRGRGGALILLFFASGSFFLSAQQSDSTVTRNITIEREYQPVIQDAGKINSLPNFIEPKVVRITPQYTSNFSKPLSVEDNIHYLASAELVQPSIKSKDGFARVGLGTGFNSLADFMFPLVKKPDMKLDFILNHYGLFNSKAHSATQAALNFDKKLNNSLNFYAGIGGRHEYFKYYGNNFSGNNLSKNSYIIDFSDLTNDTDTYVTNGPSVVGTNLSSLAALAKTNNLWRMNINTGIHTSPTTDNLRYGAHLNYNLFNAKNGITEQLAKLSANIDAELNGDRVGINFALNNLFYTTTNSELKGVLKNYSVLSLNPYYIFEKEAFDLRLGIKYSFSFFLGRTFAPSPDVHFEWRAVPQYLAVYAGATGDYQINSLNSIYLENCYLNPDVMPNDTYTPLNYYLGVKIKPTTGLLLDAYLDYKAINNEYFFVNKEYRSIQELLSSAYPANYNRYYTNRFDLIYGKAKQLRLGGRVSYNHHDKFSTRLSLAYNHWNVANFEYAWNKPAFEMDFSTNFQITHKLNTYANMYVGGKRYAKIGDMAIEMKPQIDINLGASYAVKDWLSAFLRVNNLINSKYEQWLGYEAQGFNIMVGAAFNF